MKRKNKINIVDGFLFERKRKKWPVKGICFALIFMMAISSLGFSSANAEEISGIETVAVSAEDEGIGTEELSSEEVEDVSDDGTGSGEQSSEETSFGSEEDISDEVEDISYENAEQETGETAAKDISDNSEESVDVSTEETTDEMSKDETEDQGDEPVNETAENETVSKSEKIKTQPETETEEETEESEEEEIDYFAPGCDVEVNEYQEPSGYSSFKIQTLSEPATTTIKTGYINAGSLRMRSAAVIDSNGANVIKFLSYEIVVVLGDTYDKDHNLWYRVSDGTNVGYVMAKQGGTNYVTDIKTITVKADLSAFPSSYRQKMMYILATHPNYEFVADRIGYSLEEAARWHTGYKVDMPSRTASSYSTVKEYMDPATYLNTRYIYAFADQSYNSTQNRAGLKSLFSIGKAFLDTEEYIKALLDAGKKYKVSPYVLAATILSEKGWSGNNADVTGRKVYTATIKNNNVVVRSGPGKSYSSLGKTGKGKAYVVYDPKNHTTGDWYMIMYSVNGRYVGGYLNKSEFKEAPSKFTYFNTYYNLFSINQTDDNVVVGGISYAMKKGWNTPYKSLVGGAEFYRQGYMDNRQDTYYYKDFNVINDKSNWWHEYAGAVNAAMVSGNILSNAYKNDPAAKVVFKIPVYKGVALKSMKINKTSATLATKKTLQLSVTLTPSNTTETDIIWKSSNPSVATVDSKGKVTALRYGTSTITATSAAHSNIKASCKITTRYYDVNNSSAYYYKPVYWAADAGITKGYDNVYFGPQRNCTRREMMIFLWRLSGKPEAKGTISFSDTSYKTTTDSYKAILWGCSNGIIKGFEDGTFRPDDPINRKDTMIMLYRIAGSPRTKGTVSFADVVSQNYDKASDTYNAILWGTNTKITHGYADGTFKPFADCLREHIVTFLYRYKQLKG